VETPALQLEAALAAWRVLQLGAARPPVRPGRPVWLVEPVHPAQRVAQRCQRPVARERAAPAWAQRVDPAWAARPQAHRAWAWRAVWLPVLEPAAWAA